MVQASRPLVAVLLGGPSSEHDVSLATGGLVLARLDRTRFDAAPLFVGKDATWFFGALPHPPAASWRDALAGATPWRPGGGAMPWRPDVCFIGLHGAYGEDGQVQGILEGMGIRYTGSGPAASALAMNKQAARERFRAAGLPTAAGYEVTPAAATPGVDRHLEALVRGAVQAVPGPWVVKPRDGGSSVGVEMVESEGQLVAAVRRGLRDGSVLVEQRITGRELTCGVLEEAGTGAPRALPVTEIRPKSGAFFDYRAKYTPGQSDELTPAPIDPTARDEVQRLALAAHAALGCAAYSRTDFILRPDGRPVLLETNTLPGLTATSLLPQEATAAGIDYGALLTRLLELALERNGPR